MKFKANKKLGQHFLKNNKILRILANSLLNIHNEIVIEIGGGLGNLTQFLTSAKKLIVYEIDDNLVKFLRKKFDNYKNVQIISGDFLKSNLKKFKHNYLLIGNIPYFITGKILRKIFDLDNYPKIAVITIQKEYGEKIIKESFLNFWIRNFAKIEKIITIKKDYFFPSPRVDSVALRFIFYHSPMISDLKNFEIFLKSLFRFNKRTVLNNLKFKYYDKIIKINKQILIKRPHQLTFEEIIDLFKIINEKNN